MEFDVGVEKCLTIEENFHIQSVKTHLCNESDTWDYDEKEHTLKSNGKCLTSSFEATEIWAGNLTNQTFAVLLLNRASYSSKVQFSWDDIELNNTRFKLRDLWEKKDIGEFKEKYTVYLESHDSQLLKVFPLEDKEDVVEEEEEEHKVENIVMIVLGAIILIGICAFVYIYIVNRNKQKKNEEDTPEKDDLLEKNE